MPITQSKPDVTFCIVESPYAPFTKNDPERAAVELARNEAYVNACLADSFARGEVPFASHAIYTRNTHGVKVLNDSIPEERQKGMQAGFDIARALSLMVAWTPTHLDGDEDYGTAAFVRAFYQDRGWTSGMADGMLEAGKHHQYTEKRTIDPAYWSRDRDGEWALNSNGRLYLWRRPEMASAAVVGSEPTMLPGAIPMKQG